MPHCVALRDVASGPGYLPVPILDRVQRGSVAQLLSERDSIEPGEAVTILAPLASTLTALHGAGVAHSALTAASIHLGAAGEPVLIGFGHATLFARGLSIAALDDTPSVVAERDRVARVASVILDRARPGIAAARLHELKRWLEASAGSRQYEFFGELEERLFDLAASIPVQLATVRSASISVPGRIGAPKVQGPLADEAAETTEAAGTARHRADRPRRRRPVNRAASSRVQLAIMTNPVEALKARLLVSVRGVRKPLWFAVGGVAAALVVALALVPDGRAASVSATQPRTEPISSASAAPPRTSAPSDDPVSALTGLLNGRVRCVRELSVTCLDSVDEQGSSALRDDSALILAIRSGGEIPATAELTAPEPQLVERLGDSALVSLVSLVSLGRHGDPASALMIRSKAGWRLRSYLSGKPVER